MGCIGSGSGSGELCNDDAGNDGTFSFPFHDDDCVPDVNAVLDAVAQ